MSYSPRDFHRFYRQLMILSFLIALAMILILAFLIAMVLFIFFAEYVIESFNQESFY